MIKATISVAEGVSGAGEVTPHCYYANGKQLRNAAERCDPSKNELFYDCYYCTAACEDSVTTNFPTTNDTSEVCGSAQTPNVVSVDFQSSALYGNRQVVSTDYSEVFEAPGSTNFYLWDTPSPTAPLPASMYGS